MFIVEVDGGLGNQMFKYAFVKQLEKVYPKTRVRAYISDKKNYELEQVFGIKLKECSWKMAASLSDDYPKNAPFHSIFKPLSKVRQVLFGHKDTCIKQDDGTCFYPECYHLNQLYEYYFQGVWANAEYLTGIEDEIKKDFIFRNELSETNKLYLSKIMNSCSIGIHVRRGDYVSIGASLCDEEYYRAAINYIRSKTTNPNFFIFSDEIEYCRKIFKEYKDFTYIEKNTGTQSYVDMQLMSNCKHNIIANSTFSFWGAYLNSNLDKIVVAPNVGIGTIDFNTPFACSEWIKIDVKSGFLS